MNRSEIEDFKRIIPGMIPPELRNAGILLECLGDAAKPVSELTRGFSYEDEARLIAEIKSFRLEERQENLAIIFLRSVGRHFFEARQGKKKSNHFLH